MNQINYPPLIDFIVNNTSEPDCDCAFAFAWSHRCTGIAIPWDSSCRFHIVIKTQITVCSRSDGHHEIFCFASVRLTSGNCSTFAHFQPLVLATGFTASLHWYSRQCSVLNWSWRYVRPAQSQVWVGCIPVVLQSRRTFWLFFFVCLNACIVTTFLLRLFDLLSDLNWWHLWIPVK